MCVYQKKKYTRHMKSKITRCSLLTTATKLAIPSAEQVYILTAHYKCVVAFRCLN